MGESGSGKGKRGNGRSIVRETFKGGMKAVGQDDSWDSSRMRAVGWSASERCNKCVLTAAM